MSAHHCNYECSFPCPLDSSAARDHEDDVLYGGERPALRREDVVIQPRCSTCATLTGPRCTLPAAHQFDGREHAYGLR